MRAWSIVVLLLLFSGLDLVSQRIGGLARRRRGPLPRASPDDVFGPWLFYDSTA